MDLKIEIKQKLFTKTGKVSPVRVKQHKELYNKIVESTAFLHTNACFSERIYCVLNDIKEVVKCPITNLPVKWSPQRKEYRTVVGKNNVNKVGDKAESIKKFKETVKKKRKQYEKDFWLAYKTRSFVLMSKEDVKQICVSKLASDKSNYFRPHNLYEQQSLLCSIVYYTDAGFLKNTYNSNWAERMYLIANDMPEPPACIDDISKKQFFENTKKGYRKYSSNKKRILDYTSNTVIPEIASQGFELLSDITGNLNKEIHTLKCIKNINYHSF